MKSFHTCDSQINRYYFDAAWDYICRQPFEDWFDLSNIFDGQFFE